jgi:cytochrome P450
MIDRPEVPGPPGHWLTGNLALLRRDILCLLEELPREYGDLVRLRFGGYRALLLSHPAHVEEVLVAQGGKFEKPRRFRRIVRAAFRNGIFAAEGPAWQHQRGVLESLLATIDYQQHCKVVLTCAERVLAGWPDQYTGDLAARMVDLALAVRAKTALGIERTDTLSSMHEALSVFMEYYTACLRSPLQWPLWIPAALNRRVKGALGTLSDCIEDQIRRASGIPDVEQTLIGRLLVRARSGAMSRQQLTDELATWLLTGTETTANTLAWTCYLLARNPDHDDRLLSDLTAEGHGDAGPRQDVLRTKRLGWVLSESMRLYPQAYLIGRKANAPFAIDGRTFPRNTTVILNQWSIARDPRWYENPLAFDPDRWSRDHSARVPAFAYFPFGGGARACLGRPFATVELPLLLAAVVQRFRFVLRSGAEVRPSASLTLRPLFGPGAIVTHRRSPR